MPNQPLNASHEQHETKRNRRQIVFVVVAGLLIGVCGGMLFLRLKAQGFSVASDESATGPGADDAAAQEIDQLQQTFADLVQKKSPVTGLVSTAEDIANRYPQNESAQMLYGQILLSDRQYLPAYNQMMKSLAIKPKQPEVELMAGTIAHDLNQDDLAERHYKNAVLLDPNNPRIRMHLAQLYFDKKEYDVAAAISLDILQHDSSSHQACAMLAEVLTQKGDLPHAVETFQDAIEKTPAKDHDMRAIYIRRMALLLRKMNRPTESLQALRKLDAKETTSPDVIEEIAESWAMLGRPEQAAEVFDDAASLNPTVWQFSAGAAKWYIEAGDKVNANRHIELIREYNRKLPVIADLEAMESQMKVAPPTTAPSPLPRPAMTIPPSPDSYRKKPESPPATQSGE